MRLNEERGRLPLAALVLTMRPRQFIKNCVVFLALVFTVGLAWQPDQPHTWLPLVARSCLAFAAFCAVAAAEYLVNDAADAESDRWHPYKCSRPIAAGKLSPSAARVAATVMFVAGLSLGLSLGMRFALVLGSYAILMLVYTYVLKHIAVVDVLTIAVGFALRAVAGAFAIEVPISPWLYLCTILGALLLATGKRRHELLMLEGAAGTARPSLAQYTALRLDQMSAAVAVATIVAYSLYAFTASSLPRNHVMVVTIPFVMFGVCRYLFLVRQGQEARTPDEVIVRDRPLLVCFTLWVSTAGILLVLFR